MDERTIGRSLSPERLPISDKDLKTVYKYVDEVPLSKPKKNIARDFSDCSQVALLVKHYLPKKHKNLCHPHNYPEGNKKQVKLDNWSRLNENVMKKLVGDKHPLLLNDQEMNDCADCQPYAIEKTLLKVKKAIGLFKQNPRKNTLTRNMTHQNLNSYTNKFTRDGYSEGSNMIPVLNNPSQYQYKPTSQTRRMTVKSSDLKAVMDARDPRSLEPVERITPINTRGSFN